MPPDPRRASIGKVLIDDTQPLKLRFRALFALRGAGGSAAVEWVARCLEADDSALLKHECAYCLGQMQEAAAVPVLRRVLENRGEEAIVRHEADFRHVVGANCAGEALGAIGCEELLPLLTQYSTDDMVEVAETCQLAIARIRWLHGDQNEGELSINPYSSVDPAPPAPDQDTVALRSTLLDDDLPLFTRYRAMFSLRNRGDQPAIEALTQGLTCSSALFRHEVAYVLGQVRDGAASHGLIRSLRDSTEHAMVRHECAEALGAIATDECMDELKRHVNDTARVVRESCQVALDMCDYEQSGDFQYALTAR